MAKKPVSKSAAPKSPARARASRPEVTPLDEHLAALLNPALNERSTGLSERPQGSYDAETVSSIDPALARKLAQRPAKPTAGDLSGASATVESLKDLLERGDPNLRDSQPWTPHRPLRPEKSEGGRAFEIVSDYHPAGDQPKAIADLVAGIQSQERDQVLLGVTGSGKTFTMAHVIAQTQRPALILAPNKTLAAQLYGEFKSFFPHNAVEYFVSYYDYYQPEAYVPRTDTYIEKESSINEQIDRMRHAATQIGRAHV